MSVDKPRKIQALFIGNSYMNRQEKIIPALLKPLGYEFTVRTVYAPGQTFQGHLQNNAGIITDSQKEGIERGRIGGWFSDEHCRKLYDIARGNKGYLDMALSEMKYDVAFVQTGGSDCEAPDANNSVESARILIGMIRSKNPGIPIVLYYPWTYMARPEYLPQFDWLGKRIALENDCILAPIGRAFARSKEQMPDLFMHRSKKDDHQNEKSIILISYTQICAFLGDMADKLDFSVNKADPADFAGAEETATRLDEKINAAFMQIARKVTRQAAEELAKTTLDSLVRPEIVTPDTGVTAFHCDKRVLVVGNSWFDADGAVWAELVNSYKCREEINLHVEAVADDAATFQSILANNEGQPTPRQRRIMETVGTMQAEMGRAKLDPDELDGFGDYPIAMALKNIADRKGKLDRALALKVKWDAVIVQGFRGASEPEEDDFFGCGRKLIEKIRSAVGDSPIFLMQHWAKKGADPEVQNRITESYNKLARDCSVPVIPLGEAFAARKDVELLSRLYTPNMLGVQLISETLRKYVK